MSTAPDRCGLCHAPRGHRQAACPICGAAFDHVSGVEGHLATTHVIPEGKRPRALLVDIARAQVRGWPMGPFVEAAQKAGLSVLRAELFA